jgi:O-antigen/teichoic acid export membrane protein
MRRHLQTCFDRSTPTGSVLRDTALYVAAKAVPGAIGLLSIVVFVRLLGVEQFGLFSVLFSTATLWSTFAVSWMNQGILRYWTGKGAFDEHLWQDLRRGAALALGFTTLGTAINLTMLDQRPGWLAALLTWLLAIAIALQSLSVAVWQARLAPKKVLLIEMVRTVSGFVLCIGLANCISATTQSLLAGTLAGYVLCLRWPAHTEGTKGSPGQLRRLWVYGWPLSIWLGSQAAFPWLDRTALAHLMGLEATGTFASVSDIVTRSFSLLIFPLTLAVHPRITALWNEDRGTESVRLLRLAVAGCTVACALIVLIFHLGTDTLTAWVLPAAQRHTGADAVLWLALGGAIWQLVLLVHKPLELRGQTRVMLVCVLGALLVKVGLNWWTIPRWGLRAAAAATFFSGVFYCAACLICLRFDSSRNSRHDN